MVEPLSLNFRVFTVKLGVRKFRNFKVINQVWELTNILVPSLV